MGIVRLGVAISKRVIPRAVDRNYCKRLVREVFQQEQAALAGFDFVVRPRGGMPFSVRVAARIELRELLARLLRKCRRQKSPPHDHG